MNTGWWLLACWLSSVVAFGLGWWRGVRAIRHKYGIDALEREGRQAGRE